MPICRDCGNKFNGRVKLNGKVINVWSRKYCLTCSPYKQYSKSFKNTKNTTDGKRECLDCELQLPLSEFSMRTKTSTYSSYCKKCSNIRTRQSNRKFKQECVNYKGGRCEKCGYNKSLVALDFHHKNPEEKDYIISQASRVFSDLIKAELDKCILVCANCHRELHDMEYSALPNCSAS